jgi:hypothetical protein
LSRAVIAFAGAMQAHELVAMIWEPRLTLSSVRERRPKPLVAVVRVLEFIAPNKLYQLLEEMTDDANHCGEPTLSLARKEA